MKILVVCQYYHPEPFRISDICETLVQRGHEVTVLTGLPNYPEGRVPDEYRHGKKRRETLNGVNVVRCFEIGREKGRISLFLNYFSFVISASFKAMFMTQKFDVILVNQLSPVMMGIPAMVYKRRHNKKILLYCLDLWPASLAAGGIKVDTMIYKLFLRLSKWIYSSADSILVTSSMFKDYFERTLGLQTCNMTHLPQYAEDLFSENSDVQVDKRYNFVFAGNIGDMQSVDTIVRAANELRDRPDITLHIIGDGSKSEECRLLADSFKLTNIVFYGRRPIEEMPYYYGKASAMLVTLKDNEALSYTLPGKIQSYMAAGKPIFGAINGETSRVIKASGCGLCCQAEDYKALAGLIIQFCRSDLKQNLAANAHNYYSENYSKERFMSKLEEALMNMEG